MTSPTTPSLVRNARCPVGLPVEHPIQSFFIFPDGECLLTLEESHWVTRSLATGEPVEDIPPTHCESTQAMWSDRLESPNGRWLFALNGQSSIEFRLKERFEERRIIEWPGILPYGYGFWSGDSDIFLVTMEGGVTEAWELREGRRIAHSPQRVERAPSAQYWSPTIPDGSVWMQLAWERASLWRLDESIDNALRPLGRWPVVGGGLSTDAGAALVVTGGELLSPTADYWAGGEILLFDVAQARMTNVCTHGIGPTPGLKVMATPTLTYVFMLTADGGLACVEAATGRNVWSIGIHPGIQSAAFTPDGHRCLMGLGNGEIVLIGEDPATPLWRMQGHEFGVQSVAISPDGRRALSYGVDRSLLCWDVNFGKIISGAPPRYDRLQDPARLLTDPAKEGAELTARLGPALSSPIIAADSFVVDYAGCLVYLPMKDLTHSEVLWQGPSQISPSGDGHIVAELHQDPKKKMALLNYILINTQTRAHSLLATVEVPPDIQNIPFYVSPTRMVLITPEGGLLVRLDKKLFHRQIPLELSGLQLTGVGFHVAADGSAFALSQGAELRVFSAEDGRTLGRLVLETPQWEDRPAVVSCWIGPEGSEAAVALQSGTFQRWKLHSL